MGKSNRFTVLVVAISLRPAQSWGVQVFIFVFRGLIGGRTGSPVASFAYHVQPF